MRCRGRSRGAVGVWEDDGDGEPEGGPHGGLGGGPDLPAQHRDLLAADAQAEARPAGPPGPLHVILRPLHHATSAHRLMQMHMACADASLEEAKASLQAMHMPAGQEFPAIPSPAWTFHSRQCIRSADIVLVWTHNRAQITAETWSYLDKVVEEGVQPLLGNAAACVCHLKHQPLAWCRGACLLWRASVRVWPADNRQHLSRWAVHSI